MYRGHLLNRNLSVFLDLLRLVAALLVLVGHAGEVYHLHMPDILGHSAKEGVAVFFVLSGFVIAFVTSGKEPGWRDFARARALRLVSVVPLALVVLVACYALGTYFNPMAYGLHPGQGGVEGGAGDAASANGGSIGLPPDWQGILRYLTFTNEVWFDRVVMKTGAPFWSLGFEVAYYVAFALIFYVRGPWRWGGAAAWLAVCGPRIALAFPLWLLGVGAWHIVRRMRPLGRKVGVAALCALSLLALGWRRWAGGLASPLFEWSEPQRLAASMGYYIVLGLLVAAAIVIFVATAQGRPIWPPVLERAVRYCAGASFTLYIMHLPVMVLIAALLPGMVATVPGAVLATVATIAATFALAQVGERRKQDYARAFSAISMLFSRTRQATR